MAYSNKYQYETSPKKVAPEYRPKKKQPTKTVTKKNQSITPKKQMPKSAKNPNADLAKKAKLKQDRKRKAKVIFMVMFLFLVLFVISYRSSLISENFAEIKNLKKDLEVLEKENQQLDVGIESTLNLNNIEKIATEKLGMQKLKSDQIVYVNLQREDYIQPASEKVVMEENQSFWQKILNELNKIF